jgi:hypothetical protein
MNGVRRKAVRHAAILAALLVIALFARTPILVGVAQFMTVETPIERADAIVPLYQDPLTIPGAAAAWLEREYATNIVVYRRKLSRVERLGLRPAPHVIMRRLLEERGVRPERIVEIGDEIEREADLIEPLARFLGTNSRKRVIVVASAPRSRLAWSALDDAATRAGIDLQLDAVAPKAFDEHTWWKTRDGVITYFDSYCLWLLRWIR